MLADFLHRQCLAQFAGQQMFSCQVKVISWNPVCAQSALPTFQRYRRQDDRNAGLRVMLYLQRYNGVMFHSRNAPRLDTFKVVTMKVDIQLHVNEGVSSDLP
jgi:hypothetical protein